MDTSAFHRASETAEFLQTRLPAHLARPQVAIVCGSGLGGLANTITGESEAWAYKDVPNFPISTVPGHEGKLIFGTISERKVPVVLLVGRAQYVAICLNDGDVCLLMNASSFYEGHAMEVVTFATRVCKLLGVETMIMTNAAGGLNPDYDVGDIVCLNDHLNLAGLVGFHPLRGPNDDDFGVRFPPLSDAFDISHRISARRAWQGLQADSPSNRRLHEGVYAFVAGPSYETRAECRMLRQLGADLVGMSTVPEIIVARHAGMRVLAFSLVTNKSVLEPVVRADDSRILGMAREELDEFMSRGRADHEEVLEAGQQAAQDMQGLVHRIVASL